MGLLEASGQHLPGVPVEAGEQLPVHLGDATGRLLEPLSSGVLPDGLDDAAHGIAHLGLVNGFEGHFHSNRSYVNAGPDGLQGRDVYNSSSRPTGDETVAGSGDGGH